MASVAHAVIQRDYFFLGLGKNVVLIEDAGLGTGLIQQLQAEQEVRPIACKPEGSKADRMAAQSPYIEAGHVLVPARARWLDVFRSELLAFLRQAR